MGLLKYALIQLFSSSKDIDEKVKLFCKAFGLIEKFSIWLL